MEKKKIHPKRGFIVIKTAEIPRNKKKHRTFWLQVHIRQILIVEFPFRIYLSKSALAGTQFSIQIKCLFVNSNWDL